MCWDVIAGHQLPSKTMVLRPGLAYTSVRYDLCEAGHEILNRLLASQMLDAVPPTSLEGLFSNCSHTYMILY